MMEECVRYVPDNATPKAIPLTEMEHESGKDPELCALRDCIQPGNWGNCPAAYMCVRNELCVLGKLILRDTHIVVPQRFRSRVMDLAHEGHQGIIKSNRTKVWWSGQNC